MWKKFKSWSVRSLRKEGRWILIKSVIQVIPTYAMSIIQTPQTLGKDLVGKDDDLFWWSRKEMVRKEFTSCLGTNCQSAKIIYMFSFGYACKTRVEFDYQS